MNVLNPKEKKVIIFKGILSWAGGVSHLMCVFAIMTLFIIF